MRSLVRRVFHASVEADGKKSGEIQQGLLVYVGFEAEDSESDLEWCLKKILGLRIFDDETGKMNLSVNNEMGILLVSQFTLWGTLKKGYRPSFNRAAMPEKARNLYNMFLLSMQKSFLGDVHSGKFGASMKISVIEDGPVTIWMDSKNRTY